MGKLPSVVLIGWDMGTKIGPDQLFGCSRTTAGRAHFLSFARLDVDYLTVILKIVIGLNKSPIRMIVINIDIVQAKIRRVSRRVTGARPYHLPYLTSSNSAPCRSNHPSIFRGTIQACSRQRVSV